MSWRDANRRWTCVKCGQNLIKAPKFTGTQASMVHVICPKCKTEKVVWKENTR